MAHWPVEGVASDISLGWLRDGPVLAGAFGFESLPHRVCCDAAELPFLPDTFTFVFAYRTLHHFRDPAPVVREAHRVLVPGGHMYLNHEPVDSALRRPLRGDRLLREPRTLAQRAAAHLGLQKVFWDDGGSEREAGILEARFDLGRWLRALEPFELVSATVNRRLRLRAGTGGSRGTERLAAAVGGNLEALCRKQGSPSEPGDWRLRLRCLDCDAVSLDHHAGDGSARCRACGRVYSCVDGVLVMLRYELQRQLYPHIVHLSEA